MDAFSTATKLGFLRYLTQHFEPVFKHDIRCFVMRSATQGVVQPFIKYLTVCCLLFALGVTPVQASWQTLLPDAKPIGSGELRRFGFLIYDAQFFTSSGRFSLNQPFALQLVYARTIAKDRIVTASLDELKGLGFDVGANPQWQTELDKVLADVKEGDTLTGVYLPGQGAAFFLNDQLTGRLDDLLAQAFFSIWLDPRTSEPELRNALIGESK
jgi:hypothetical protein